MTRVDEQGWTLLEMIGTLSLITFMTAIALPSLIPLGQQLERDMYTSLLVDELLYAQTQAISQEQEIEVRLHQRMITIYTNKRQLRQIRLPHHLQVYTNFPQQKIFYREQGHARGGTVYLYRYKKCIAEIRIQVVTGYPKVVKQE